MIKEFCDGCGKEIDNLNCYNWQIHESTCYSTITLCAECHKNIRFWLHNRNALAERRMPLKNRIRLLFGLDLNKKKEVN